LHGHNEVSKHVSLVPFISTNWSAHSGQAMNNLLPSPNPQTGGVRLAPGGYAPVIENFAIVTGIYGTYSF